LPSQTAPFSWDTERAQKASDTGELCFNTAITGYQEILTDPSYASQIVLFTFPHIGNVGANGEDNEESSDPASHAARGAIFREPITAPSNWRSTETFESWLAETRHCRPFGRRYPRDHAADPRKRHAKGGYLPPA
jgi:carbamoylphosphate synthase small subunit